MKPLPTAYTNTPCLNPEPPARWLGRESVVEVTAMGSRVMALLDTGSRVSTVTPSFVLDHDLPVYPLSALVPDDPRHQIVIKGVAGMTTVPIGYCYVFVEKVDGVAGFHDWIIALVIEDLSQQAKRVPLLLGTPCLDQIIACIKESEEGALPPAVEMVTRLSALRAQVPVMTVAVEDPTTVTNREGDAREVEELVRLKDDTEVPPWSMAVVKGVTALQFLGYRANVMISKSKEDEGLFPEGVYVKDTYATMANGSKYVSVVVANESPKFVRLSKGTALGRVGLATKEPLRVMKTDLPGQELSRGEAELPGHDLSRGVPPRQRTLTEEERHTKLLEQLDLAALDGFDPEVRQQAVDLLLEYHDVFSLDDFEIGETEGRGHEIKLSDPEPFKERFRRIPPPLVDEVRDHIKQMLDAGVIAPSESPWSNAVVLVRKKDGGLRFCIDFRRLNAKTVKDSYALPRVDEVLDSLQGACYFSSLDLKSGFWQIPMAGDSRQKTAFTVGNLGFYEFLRMPFGLTNAPATFQRAMERCLGDMNLVECLIYLDDVIVFSGTMQGHLERLKRAFQRFRDAKMKLKPSKCELFRTKLTYVGHVVSREGILPDPSVVEDVLKMPVPTTYTQIRQFLGMAGYYRRFIKGYSKLIHDLNDYLKGEGAGKKKEEVTLSPEAVKAFEDMKQRLCTAPVLLLPDFEKPFILETDASGLGLGAVLSQKGEDGKMHPVAYASRVLKPAERNYHSGKLEFLALYWAVTKHFAGYLRHAEEFYCYTDNNPLTYVLTTAKLDACGHRWVADLARFRFSIAYQPGKDNLVADALSRYERLMTRDEVKAALSGAVLSATDRAEAHTAAMINRCKEDDDEMEVLSMPLRPKLPMHMVDWAQAQREDPQIEAVIKWMESYYRNSGGNPPGNQTRYFSRKGRLGFAHQMKQLTDAKICREWSASRFDFRLRHGMLYRAYQPPGDAETVECFVVPEEYREAALDGCHRDAGHQGRDRTLSLLRERFWWPGMKKDLLHRLESCPRCLAYKAPVPRGELRPIVVTAPLELVHVDFTSVENTADPKVQPKAHNLLVIQDHFTKYMMAHVTPDQKAITVARYLWETFFSVFGPPARLISDQGANFTSEIITELCKMLHVEKIKTTAYHAQGNGQVERAHQTIFRMLGTLPDDLKNDWPRELKALTFAYNATRSQITGYSPYYLMFGMRPRIPIDFLFPTIRVQPSKPSSRPVDEYVVQLQSRLRTAFTEAKLQASREAKRQKILYDRRAGSSILESGDRVLIRLDAVKGKRKIKDRWGNQLLTIERRMGDESPLYRVEFPDGKTNVVHRNRLLFISRGNPTGEPLVLAAATVGPVPSISPNTEENKIVSESRRTCHPLTQAVLAGERSRVGWPFETKSMQAWPALYLARARKIPQPVVDCEEAVGDFLEATLMSDSDNPNAVGEVT